MSHTDVHAPFHTTEYDKIVPDSVVLVADGSAYHRIDGIDYTEYNRQWQKAVKHIARPEYEKVTRRKHNRQRRNTDRNVCRKITRDPSFYDEAEFADHRADRLDWS